jgi:pimeloyl-ACP methyl ester carboxylesterase
MPAACRPCPAAAARPYPAALQATNPPPTQPRPTPDCRRRRASPPENADLLGFGASDKPLLQYTIELWADLVADFTREFATGSPQGGGGSPGGRGAVLVGNSIGSLVCLAVGPWGMVGVGRVQGEGRLAARAATAAPSCQRQLTQRPPAGCSSQPPGGGGAAVRGRLRRVPPQLGGRDVSAVAGPPPRS